MSHIEHRHLLKFPAISHPLAPIFPALPSMGQKTACSTSFNETGCRNTCGSPVSGSIYHLIFTHQEYLVSCFPRNCSSGTRNPIEDSDGLASPAVDPQQWANRIHPQSRVPPPERSRSDYICLIGGHKRAHPYYAGLRKNRGKHLPQTIHKTEVAEPILEPACCNFPHQF